MLFRYPPLLNWNISKTIKDYLDGYVNHETSEFLDSQNCTGGIKWILDIFGDCVDTHVKLAGFIIGFISLILWLVPLFPQLYENYKRKRCEAFSIYFLLFWIIGDICNMVGAILTNQQPLQKIIGIYYICQDMVLFSQYAYYNKFNPNQASRHGNLATPIVVPVVLLGMVGANFLLPEIAIPSSKIIEPIHKRTLMSVDTVQMPPIFQSYTDILGYVIGSFASLCYFSGRIPQMRTNYYRKSCEGLSPIMFYIIIVANLTYGLSVILETTGWLYMVRHLPWLFGSLGCCFFDCMILSQYYYYKKLNASTGNFDEEEALLHSGD